MYIYIYIYKTDGEHTDMLLGPALGVTLQPLAPGRPADLRGRCCICVCIYIYILCI